MLVSALFDLDGTLTDPGEGFVNCIAHALSKLDGPRHTDEEIRSHVGPPLEEGLRKLLHGNDALVPAAVALYRERYASEGYLQNVVYPGTERTLERLNTDGVALFVATSKPLIFATRILDHFRLTRFFRGIYGSGLDGTRSNKVDLIAHVMVCEALDPATTVMIGDRAHDMVGARANGILSVGALWGYGAKEELARAGATIFCEQPALLPEMLSKLFPKAA